MNLVYNNITVFTNRHIPMKRTKKNGYYHDCVGFSKLDRDKRIRKLIELKLINNEDAAHLRSKNKLSFSLAENLIENVIGYFQMPLGVAVNFVIDSQEYVIPMVVEETSVIAAASKTAKWIKDSGEIITENISNIAIGQIQLPRVKNFNSFKKQIEACKHILIADVNKKVASSMVKRGGGVKDLVVRRIARKDHYDMSVIHVLVETCDSMGANLINQICEYLKSPIETLTDESVNLCILSNLSDTKLTRAKIIIEDIDVKLGKAIEEASIFAHLDPYRAATNNKGVLNGMDAVAIATGNDWRALEAGIHAYAAQKGKYGSITNWKMHKKKLIGILEAPINVATVGGVTKIHPTASLCLKILGISKASHLSRIIAAVGLVQNLGALKALSTDGIVKGHMRLHTTNLCLAAGASNEEIMQVKEYIKNRVGDVNHITKNDVMKILDKIRKK